MIGAGIGSAPAEETTREARIAYLKKHAVPVRSIEAKDADFADLEPLRQMIGGRRIVMLGECSHGDGATFAAKVRLIKFLHQRMGFDVFAFESGLYDTHKA
jgi:erythromycin esterase